MAVHSDSVSVMSDDADETTHPSSVSGVHTRRRYVICVDYGTTYTGVAWILTNPPAQPIFSDIKIVKNWTQDHGTQKELKVPSEYTYSANEGENWGFNIGETAYVIRWSKLQLEVPDRLSALRSMKRSLQEARKLEVRPEQQWMHGTETPTHLAKTSSDTVSEYLGEVMRQVRADIESLKDAKTLEQFPVDVVITHPAKWDSRAKNITFRAVMSAFKATFRDIRILLGQIRLATEPEACAQYTLQGARADGMITTNQLMVGECFIVVDAGGGTVDLVSYVINQLTPEFKITKITPVSGAACGATEIDRFFLYQWLPKRLGSRNYQRLLMMGGAQDRHGSSGHTILKKGENHMLKKFQFIKHGFSGPTDAGEPCADMVLGLPPDHLFPDDPNRRIRNGQLLVSCHDMETMFAGCIKGIRTLIEKQLMLIERARGRNAPPLKVRNIFLSGGFSQNEYLLRRVKQLARHRQSEVIRAKNPSIAVAGGGVLLGLGLECRAPPSVVPCPFDIGVQASTRFTPYDHDESQRHEDTIDGEVRARHHIEWFALKGDLLRDEPTTKTVNLVWKCSPGGSRRGRVTIIASSSLDGDPDTFSPADGEFLSPSRAAQAKEMANSEGCILEPHRDVYLIDFNLKIIPPDDLSRLLQRKDEGHNTANAYLWLDLQLEVYLVKSMARFQLVCGKVVDATGQVEAPGHWLGSPVTIHFPSYMQE